jgi:hypothetical protein
MQLGDLVEKALHSVGVTKERVKNFLGRECRCGERKEKLNQLGAWAYRVITLGIKEDAEKHLETILSQPKEDPKAIPFGRAK